MEVYLSYYIDEVIEYNYPRNYDIFQIGEYGNVDLNLDSNKNLEVCCSENIAWDIEERS